MVGSLIKAALTPTPRPVRAIGYPTEIIGIRGRYRRCHTHWESHVAHCRATILKGMERCVQRRKAIVMGAGLLHDVPLAELSETFREVILVDIVHPLASRWKTRHFRNVQRLTADITNTVVAAYNVAWDADKPLPQSKPTLFLDDPEVDFSVSVNLLSQLPCMPMAYLKRQHAHSEAKVEDFARALIQAHLDYLSALPGCVTLITDVERLKYTMLGQLIEQRDLFFGLKLPKWGEEWEWKLAPCPEADPHFHYYRRVVGIPDWK